jgi:hypothetical protein
MINRLVRLVDTTTGRADHITRGTKDFRGVEVAGWRRLGRESEAVGISRVRRQGQRQGQRQIDSGPRALKLVVIGPSWIRM